MRPIRRILVAVKDPAAKSLPAVRKAAQLAKVLGAHLELFHGISSPLYTDAFSITESLGGIAERARSECLRKLERLATRLRAGDIKVSVSAEWDYPIYEAIVRRAVQFKADLVVASRTIGRHIAPSLLQLTDWELLRLCPMPVLLVKTGGEYKRPVVLAAIDPSHTFSKPEQLDNEILAAGSAIANALRGELHALHAYIPVSAFPYEAVAADTVDRLQRQAAAEAQRHLNRALSKSKITNKFRHLVGRHPTDAIGQVSHEIRSDIVVMGAVSRSGIKRLIIGNTAENVLDYLPCDLLIVKPKGFRGKVTSRRRGVRLDIPAAVRGL